MAAQMLFLYNGESVPTSAVPVIGIDLFRREVIDADCRRRPSVSTFCGPGS